MAEGGMMPGRYHQLCPRVAESAFFDGLFKGFRSERFEFQAVEKLVKFATGLSHTETSRDGEENGQVEALQNLGLFLPFCPAC